MATDPGDPIHALLSAADTALLERAYPEGLPAPGGSIGLFAADGALRRLSRDNVVVLGGGCALLLEVAHPLVAAGVARFSNFREDPLGRLHRTLDAVGRIAYGSISEALAAVRQIERAHRAIEGELGEAAGVFQPRAKFEGKDPELVRWVWATLLWTTVRAHERLRAPIQPGVLDELYRDHRRIALLLGVPDSLVPADFASFVSYFDAMIDSDQIVLTAEAREIARFVLHPPGGIPGGSLVRSITAALLPEPLVRAYEIPWGERERARIDSLVRGSSG